MNRTILMILAVLLVLLAVGMTVYPLIANYVNNQYLSIVRSDYENAVKDLDSGVYDVAREAAQAYNESLNPIRYDKDAVEAASATYYELLDLTGSGLMGYVEIPKLELQLPIYHGTEEEVLQKGVGHLIGSSLPIGGAGCHSVLTGHSGIAVMRLFSDLDQLSPGDVFFLRVLGETLAYQVVEINTVLPYETDLLLAVPGEDLCTLVTCTPFGVNTHRLLVRGSRIPNEKAEAVAEVVEKAAPVKSTWEENYRKGLVIGGGLALGVILLGLLVAFLRNKRRKRHEA